MASSCPDGIPADSDVAGIGTRIAIYAQAGFSTLPLILMFVMAVLRLPTDKVMDMYTRSRDYTWSFYLTGLSMLVASYVELSTRTLSVYHAAIVLNLNWIIVVIWLNSHVVTSLLFMQRKVDSRSRLHQTRKLQLRNCNLFSYFTNRYIAVMILYLICIGALGLRLFQNPYAFSATSECVDDTVFWIFGVHVPVAARGAARAWYGAYVVMLIPYANFLLLSLLYAVVILVLILGLIMVGWPIVLCIKFIWSLFHAGERPLVLIDLRSEPGVPHSVKVRILFIGLIHVASNTLLAFLIASNEKMIGENPVADGEMAWGFGQILNVMLLIIPAFDALEDLRNLYSAWKERNATTGPTPTLDGDMNRNAGSEKETGADARIGSDPES